jgi:hypothetical protein
MHHISLSYAFLALVAAAGRGIATPVLEKPPVSSASVRPFKVDLSDRVPRMLKLIRENKLPDEPEYPGLGSSLGIDLDVLKGLKRQWLDGFDWKKEQDAING